MWIISLPRGIKPRPAWLKWPCFSALVCRGQFRRRRAAYCRSSLLLFYKFFVSHNWSDAKSSGLPSPPNGRANLNKKRNCPPGWMESDSGKVVLVISKLPMIMLWMRADDCADVNPLFAFALLCARLLVWRTFCTNRRKLWRRESLPTDNSGVAPLLDQTTASAQVFIHATKASSVALKRLPARTWMNRVILHKSNRLSRRDHAWRGSRRADFTACLSHSGADGTLHLASGGAAFPDRKRLNINIHTASSHPLFPLLEPIQE